MLTLDHVILAVRDLDAAAQKLWDDHGLGSVPGGNHDGIGTGNRIVPLGDGYIELMGVTDPATAAANDLGRFLTAFVEDGDRLLMWCVATNDIAFEARRIGTAPAPWTRHRPDGTDLAWRLAGIEGALADRSLPFFIQWDIPPEDHPGREQADHRVAVHGISMLEVAGDKGKVTRRIDHADLPVRIVKGDPGPVSVSVATDGDDIVLS